MSLELNAITKSFGALVANDGINLAVNDGEIHAILGENGAGKSTLMNIVYGLLQPDSGEIKVDGKVVTINEPSDALAVGIGMVHQHFMLIPVFTVLENIVLGHENTSKVGKLKLHEARERLMKIANDFGFEIDPDAYVENLPVGVQQRVEILKALVYEAKVLILDEPTAVLTPQETDELIEVMKRLRAQGTSIIFISHKLREVKAVADRITVIRRGKVVTTAEPSASQEELAALMVGRPVNLMPDKNPPKVGAPILVVKDLEILDPSGRALVSDVDFEVCAGEVLAIAGVQGNGQSELAEAMVNLQSHVRGSITVGGVEIVGKSVHESLHEGIAFVPESRELNGLIGSFSIAENLILDTHREAPYAKGFALSPKAVAIRGEEQAKEFDIRYQSIQDPVSSLSGGNKQKVVVARELSRPVKLVVASQPTRGLDVGSIEFVHERILAERDAGRAVLLFSTELDEVVALADRIAVMYAGKILAIVEATVSREELGLLMAGIKK
ncbi:MAG: ABC transporter ATP-binding protein [Actinomycetes bacterium]